MGRVGHLARGLGDRNAKRAERRQADPGHSRSGSYSVRNSRWNAGSGSSPATSWLSELICEKVAAGVAGAEGWAVVVSRLHLTGAPGQSQEMDFLFKPGLGGFLMHRRHLPAAQLKKRGNEGQFWFYSQFIPGSSCPASGQQAAGIKQEREFGASGVQNTAPIHVPPSFSRPHSDG